MDLKAGYELIFGAITLTLYGSSGAFGFSLIWEGWGLDMGIRDFLGESQLGRRRELKKIDFERFESNKSFGFVEIFEIPVIRGSKKENK
ncbi:hypothetical protein FH972_014574 [Carpinus fangiana]|uniref:Uncharacterized protein n=1 Tax=Carpinus fangiana TaxID=176857 RepID=A0A5N6RDS3_9ROSI|nr:hypothetical protein FH972_014574 [Carpinus fangiana]